MAKNNGKTLDREVTRYSILCNLIEAIWLQRRAKKYYDIDLDAVLAGEINLTSPQARKIATFIDELYRPDLKRGN